MSGKEGVKIRITRNRLILLLISLVLISSILFYYMYVPKPILSWDFLGNKVYFRANLREAAKVPVYPNEWHVYNEIVHTLVDNVTFVFKPTDEKGNPYYILEEMEIIQKLKLVYNELKINPGFNGHPVESYENLPGKIQNPIIALVHPDFSNETAVIVKDHVIYIKGKTNRDFDLATIKFLMIAMSINLTA